MRSTTTERLAACRAARLAGVARRIQGVPRAGMPPMFARASDAVPGAGALPLTAGQVAAVEQLVISEVRATLALDKIAALCETRNRAVIAAAAAVAGFDVINARVVSSQGPGAGS
jgi:hypothetical protein